MKNLQAGLKHGPVHYTRLSLNLFHTIAIITWTNNARSITIQTMTPLRRES